MNRNRTWGATIFTGLTAFMLLAIAMVMGASRTSIVAGATFFFVGATVGLLGRLRSQMEEEGGVPDYGLSTARLYSTPVICGLAAIGGVLLVAILPYGTNAFSTPTNLQTNAAPTGTNVTTIRTNPPANIPSTTSAALGGTSTVQGTTSRANDQATPPADSEKKPRLTNIFDLEKNLVGVLVAAVFGLTPGLLFNRLQDQAEKYKSEIKTSEASQSRR
jgi:hypothetical protein